MRQALQVLAAAASHMQAVYELEPGLGLQLGLAPPIPDSWTATALTSQTGVVRAASIDMAEDNSAKRRLTSRSSTYPYAPLNYPADINMSSFVYDGGQTEMINGIYLPSSTNVTFNSIFAWLPAAHDGGVVTHNGKPAHAWVISFPSAGYSAELLFGKNNLPVAMQQNFTDPVSKLPGSVTYEFTRFKSGTTPDWNTTWSTMKQACAAPPRCKKPAGVQPMNITMYIFHPPGDFEIAGQDLGDPLGDVTFVCQDILGGKPNTTDHNYQWVSEWTIELLPWWGQYQNCNGYGAANRCISQETYLVGRETPEYIKQPGQTALHRQCGPMDPLLGQWFSLPAGGECKGGAAPSDKPASEGGCSWRRAERVKTVDGSGCLITTHDFKSLCSTDARDPFPSATAAFLAAFASEDASKGGCPEVGRTGALPQRS